MSGANDISRLIVDLQQVGLGRRQIADETGLGLATVWRHSLGGLGVAPTGRTLDAVKSLHDTTFTRLARTHRTIAKR